MWRSAVSDRPPQRPGPELLAPAGDADSLLAALQAGANAVYFGLDDGLNARARARNFSLAALPQTCDQIHRAGALAYLTLNTLVFEHELAMLEDVLRQVAAAGVDAVIVQDPAVALLCRALAPTLQVHASTQMTISSAEGARFAQQLGVTRVVVPRELSIPEIRQFAAGTDLELEVFVHGALCMSWSGQCLTSEAWGGRSANRGQCAQSCRMPYDLVVDGQRRPLGEVQYLLSPQDLLALPLVSELASAGVHGLKIEGRQKGPQYVHTAVSAYRAALDSLGSAAVPGQRTSMTQPLTALSLSYSRGFSQGFLAGADHQQLVEGRFPKHRGLLLGEVAEVAHGALRVVRAVRHATGGFGLHPGQTAPSRLEQGDAVPRPGMGIGVDTGRPEAEEPGGALFGVEPTQDGWWLRLGTGDRSIDLRGVLPGHRVWLTQDPLLVRQTEKLLQAHAPQGRIAVSLAVQGAVGAPLQTTWTAHGPIGRNCTVQLASDLPLAAAAGSALDDALLRDKLGALGGTPFSLHDLALQGLAGGLHLPVSALKALRRAAVDQLWQQIAAAHVHAVDPAPIAGRVRAEAAALHAKRPLDQQGLLPHLVPLVRTEAQLQAVIDAGVAEVILDWMDLVGLTRAVDQARAAGLRVVIATVRVQKPGEDGFDRRFARLQPDGVVVRHWGALMHFSALAAPPRVHADFSLNVTNSVTAHHLLALGADTVTAAHDLDVAQLRNLLDFVPPERVEVVVHHHIATFHTEHCVYAHLLSHGKDFHSCGRPCEQHAVSLADHQGKEHPVIVDVGCRNTVFNAQAQSAAAAVPELLARGVRRFRVEFVREDRAATLAVLAAYQALLRCQLTPAALLAQVQVHEQFGVTAGTMRTWGGQP